MICEPCGRKLTEEPSAVCVQCYLTLREQARTLDEANKSLLMELQLLRRRLGEEEESTDNCRRRVRGEE